MRLQAYGIIETQVNVMQATRVLQPMDQRPSSKIDKMVNDGIPSIKSC